MFKPRQDYILVKPLERKASNIIHAVLHELPNLGVVVAVGPGKLNKKGKLQPLDVQVGDTIRFGEFKNMFPEYFENNERFLIIQEADIAGIVDDVSRETIAA
jgi:chaperonin GroES